MPVANGAAYDPAGSLVKKIQVKVKYDTAKFISYTPTGGSAIDRIQAEDNQWYDASFVMTSVSAITLDVQVSITTNQTRARVFPLAKTESNSAKTTKTGDDGTGKANGTDTGAYFTVPLTALSAKTADTGWIDVGYVYVNGGATTGESLAPEASVAAQSITSVTFTDPSYTA